MEKIQSLEQIELFLNNLGFECVASKTAGTGSKYFTFQKGQETWKIRFSDHDAANWRMLDAELYFDCNCYYGDDIEKVRPYRYNGVITRIIMSNQIEIPAQDVKLELTKYEFTNRKDVYIKDEIISERTSKKGLKMIKVIRTEFGREKKYL